MANIQNNRKNHSMWPLPQNNYNYLRQQWCLHVRSSVRTHVRTYVRTLVCTYTPHVRSYRVSVVQSGQFKICIRAFGRTKIVPHYFCTTEKCTTERTTERPNVRPNVRPNDQKRTTERPKAYDRATAIRRTERTCECADVRPTKNTHRVFFIRKNLLWAFFFKFLVGHSMKKLTLTTTVPSECRLSYLFTKACVWHQRSGLSHFDPS